MFSKIAQFTKAASEAPLPDRPIEMSIESVEAVTGFVVEELLELIDATTEDVEERFMRIIQAQISLFKKRPRPTDLATGEDAKKTRIAGQMDALVDISYFCGDAGAKAGFELDPVFEIVQEANMRKVDKVTGKVLRREGDGKILKPEGWTPPDIKAEVERQLGK